MVVSSLLRATLFSRSILKNRMPTDQIKVSREIRKITIKTPQFLLRFQEIKAILNGENIAKEFTVVPTVSPRF